MLILELSKMLSTQPGMLQIARYRANSAYLEMLTHLFSDNLSTVRYNLVNAKNASKKMIVKDNFSTLSS